MRGLALSTARCKISTGLLVGFFSEMLSKALYTIRCAVLFLPHRITVLTSRDTRAL